MKKPLQSRRTKSERENILMGLLGADKNYQVPTSVVEDKIGESGKKILDSQKINRELESLFPKLKLASEMAVSMTLSPKDLDKVVLQYSTSAKYPPEVISSILSVISDEMDNTYKLTKSLHNIVKTAMYKTGSYSRIVIPSDTIDQYISDAKTMTSESVNSFIKRKSKRNLLGGSNDSLLTGESGIDMYHDDPIPYLTTTDDWDILLRPTMKKSLTGESVNRLINNKTSNMSRIKVPDEISKGRPYVIDVPSDSIMPVLISPDPSKPIGYFVSLNSNHVPGATISNKNSESNTNAAFNNTFKSMDIKSEIQKAHDSLYGMEKRRDIGDRISDDFPELVNSLLKEKLSNGIYGDDEYEIDGTDYIYEVLWTRMLARKKTTLLFIPSELVVYYAYDYHSSGIGKTKIHDMVMIGSMRAGLLYSRFMAGVNSSIKGTNLDIELDENDPDPDGTIEQAIEGALSKKVIDIPFGLVSHTDIIPWAAKVGQSVTYNNHSGIPDTKLTFSEKDPVVTDSGTSTDLEEMLAKQHMSGYGITEDMLDSGVDAAFASTSEATRILTFKTIRTHQEATDDFNAKFVKITSSLDNNIRETAKERIDGMKSVIRKFIGASEYKKLGGDLPNKVYDDIVDGLSVTLPAPDGTSFNVLNDEYDKYRSALEDRLDDYFYDQIDDDEISGEVGEKFDNIKETYKAYFLRKWCSQYGFMEELNEITEMRNGKYIIPDIVENHLGAVMMNALEYIKATKGVKDKSDTILGRIDEEEEEDEEDDNMEDNEDNVNDDEEVGEDNEDDEEVGEDNEDEGNEETEDEETGEDEEHETEGDDTEDDETKDDEDDI